MKVNKNKVVMFEWVKLLLKRISSLISRGNKRSDMPFIWCLVGNIAIESKVGEKKEIRTGTKHFSPNTKVYCFPPQWGDGYEKILVIGKHRKSSRKVLIVIPSKRITNWRIKKVYDPFVLKMMKENHGWTNGSRHKEIILNLVESLNKSVSIILLVGACAIF